MQSTSARPFPQAIAVRSDYAPQLFRDGSLCNSVFGSLLTTYDPTCNNTQGRVTVAFRGNWAQATDIARTNVHSELVKVA